MKHRVGALALDVAFALTQPWTVLFGPSGSGKSTILRVIAGLVRPDAARIAVRRGKRTSTVVDTANGVWMPAHTRPVRWAGQRPALFPHMTVRENLGFASEIKNADLEDAMRPVMECFRLAQLGDRKPATLSGGEQQRVSIARAAVAANGRLLLLDEPFTGLDGTLRDELLADLKLWASQTKTPILSVTHDIAEAFQLNAEVLKLRDGRIAAQGPAGELLAQERRRLMELLGARGDEVEAGEAVSLRE
jgi:molybdate transport system ATP-binding protein